jgi:hypothetical protein
MMFLLVGIIMLGTSIAPFFGVKVRPRHGSDDEEVSPTVRLITLFMGVVLLLVGAWDVWTN